MAVFSGFSVKNESMLTFVTSQFVSGFVGGNCDYLLFGRNHLVIFILVFVMSFVYCIVYSEFVFS